MAHLINSTNCLTAWRDASAFMLKNGNGFNLIVNIENPLDFTEAQLNEITSTRLISNITISDVINTIFPFKSYLRMGLHPEDFYSFHEELYARGKKRTKNKSRWGNYFLRFTRFGNAKSNQLQNIITAINSRSQNHVACYNMHTSSIDLDNNTKHIGNPCLQYVQFAIVDNSIHLTAVYRNHDFLHKALGNYIGLARLLEFVCNSTKKSVGSVTCHSIHYYLDQHRKVSDCLDKLTW